MAGLYASRDLALCYEMLLGSEQTKCLHLVVKVDHIENDADLESVRELAWFKELVFRVYSK